MHHMSAFGFPGEPPWRLIAAAIAAAVSRPRRVDDTTLFFVDLEASSLMAGSFPIEVGWISADGRSECHLIRPVPAWDDWSSKSECLHGIAREHLEARGHRRRAASPQRGFGCNFCKRGVSH
jgi:hypothetical protein